MYVNRVNGVEIITGYTQQEWLHLRAKDITSTDAAALFGISPYLTPFELWHRKKTAAIVELEPSDRMRWGTRLQDSIAAGIAEDKGWQYRRKDEYVRKVKLAMGSSFDFEVLEGGENPLLEIKNVDALAFKEGWLIDKDSVEAPPHIELQVQHQLNVANRKIGYIGALIGGNRVVLIRRERDEKVIASLESKIQEFWHSIDRNIEPKPDFAKDAEFIKSLYAFAQPGKVVTGTPKMADLVADYQKMKKVAKNAEEMCQGFKAELLTMIGDAERVLGDTFTLSAGMIGPADISYHREGYRDFRVYSKKAIKEKING